MNRRLFCFGLGYSAQALARRLFPLGWQIAGTARDGPGLARLQSRGIEAFRFDDRHDLPPGALDGATHLLSSIPPDERGDPVLLRQGREIAARAGQFAWAGYLSTTGVYGDAGGGWVDEATPPAPATGRGRRRRQAEEHWGALGLPLHIFRLAGIYGPGRNPLIALLDGTAKRVVKPGQVFGRIHVEDIAGILEASIERPRPGAIYNVCDDEPAPPQDVVAFAARLLGLPPPPEIPLEAAGLSSMARSFYAESKRVANAKVKRELGYRLRFPSYREGLGALLSDPEVLGRLAATGAGGCGAPAPRGLRGRV